MSGKEITFQFILGFFESKKMKIGYVAGITFCLFILFMLIIYWMVPKTNLYTQEIQINLNNGDAKNPPAYPNGKIFNQFDIISTPVLKEVYQKNDLEKIISYQDFSKLFSVSAYVPGRAFLDAEYEQKLNNAKRTLSLANLKELEKEYNEKLALLNHHVYTVTMKADAKIPAALALKMIAEIPLTWTTIYRITEAKVFPRDSFDQNMEKKLRDELKRSQIIAIDRAAYYYEKMMNLCNTLDVMRKDRAIILPSGEHLGDLIESLNYIKNYQIDLLRQIIFAGKLTSDMDRLFILSRIQYLEQQKTAKTAEYQAIQNALQILQAKQDVKTERVSGNTDKGTQINIDANVFSKITEMLRADAFSEMRKKLSAESLECGKQLAMQESELKYYNQIYDGITSPRQQSISKSVANKELDLLFDAMLNNLLMTSRKINVYKELMIKEYFSNTEFYVPVSPSQYSRIQAISTIKLLAFTVLGWAVLNLLFVLVLFQKYFMAADKKEEQK